MASNAAVQLKRSPARGGSVDLPAGSLTPDLSKAERLALLAARPLLRDLGASVLEEIDAACESVRVPGGATIVERGETGVPLFLVARGGLRASFIDKNGRPQTAFEYFRGSTVGESFVLSGRPSPFELRAIRDSHLLRLSPEKFNGLMARHPDLAQRFARAAVARLLDLVDSPETLATFSAGSDRLPRSVALMTVGGAAVRRTRDLLAAALSEARATTRLGARDARQAMDAGIERHLDDPSSLLVLDCDGSEPSWLDFSLRQADRIMVLLDVDEGPRGKEADWWRKTTLEGRPGHVELAIVHPPSTELPNVGAAFAKLAGVARLHHVRGANPGDAQRLARWLMDRPIGLVLGGGGAYGIAHVGVLKALDEARVPIDVVGGTSMGAIVAGAVALGWSPDRLMGEMRRLFSSRFVLYDPTIPLSALLAGKKLDRVLQKFFDDIPIADLWVPFFSVATDISRARPHVYDSGSLRDAIRSSCSIPGVFPPFREADQLLVDGGLVDNLPIDVMGARCHGPIIAVDVFPYDLQAEEPKSGSKGRLHALLRRLGPLAQSRLRLFETLMRSTIVGSRNTTEKALSGHPPALRLVPDLSKFNVLEWGAYEALFEAGYACARRELAAGALPRALWEGRIEDSAPVPRPRP